MLGKEEAVVIQREYNKGVLAKPDDYIHEYDDDEFFPVKNGHVNGSIAYYVEVRLTDEQLEKLLSEAIIYEISEACEVFRDAKDEYENILTMRYTTGSYYYVETFSRMSFEESSIEFSKYLGRKNLYSFRHFNEIDDLIIEAINADLKLLDAEISIEQQDAA